MIIFEQVKRCNMKSNLEKFTLGVQKAVYFLFMIDYLNGNRY